MLFNLLAPLVISRGRLLVTDVAMPQVWPRKEELVLIPPSERHRLIFFSGRIQNSIVRRELIDTWENDEDMDIISSDPPFPYEEGFRRSKYCLHVKGYEVNTARISDPLHYGCVPGVLSNYYDLPFANVLDWSKFSIIVNHRDINSLKEVLLSVPGEAYEDMFQNLCQVRRHFVWHETPRDYDAFYMTAYQLWLRRGICLDDIILIKYDSSVEHGEACGYEKCSCSVIGQEEKTRTSCRHQRGQTRYVAVGQLAMYLAFR